MAVENVKVGDKVWVLMGNPDIPIEPCEFTVTEEYEPNRFWLKENPKWASLVSDMHDCFPSLDELLNDLQWHR